MLSLLGPATETRRQTRRWAIWDSWVLLAVILVLATTEWLMRKKAGLP